MAAATWMGYYSSRTERRRHDASAPFRRVRCDEATRHTGLSAPSRTIVSRRTCVQPKSRVRPHTTSTLRTPGSSSHTNQWHKRDSPHHRSAGPQEPFKPHSPVTTRHTPTPAHTPTSVSSLSGNDTPILAAPPSTHHPTLSQRARASGRKDRGLGQARDQYTPPRASKEGSRGRRRHLASRAESPSVHTSKYPSWLPFAARASPASPSPSFWWTTSV